MPTVQIMDNAEHNATSLICHLEAKGQLSIDLMRRLRNRIDTRLLVTTSETKPVARVLPVRRAPPPTENNPGPTRIEDYDESGSFRRLPTERGSTQDEQRHCRLFQEAVATLEAIDAPIYVDVQYLFTFEGRYVIKEFCAECDGYPEAWTTVKSPQYETTDAMANRYRESQIHGLSWEDGVMWLAQLRETTSTLFGGHRTVFVKNDIEAEILVSVLGISPTDITDLSNLYDMQNIRRYCSLTQACPFHQRQRSGLECAKRFTRSMIVHATDLWNEPTSSYSSEDESIEREPPTYAVVPSSLPATNNDEPLCRQFQEAVGRMETTDAPIYVDIQYLKTINNEFVMKEFCAECDGYPAACVTVKSPQDETPDIAANRYGENHLHGLNWDDGVMWPAQLRSTTSKLFGSHRNVFVKGDAKIHILVSELGIPHTDITELSNMPSLRVMRRDVTLTEACSFHVNRRGDLACAKKHTRSIIVYMDRITTQLPQLLSGDPIQPESTTPPPSSMVPTSQLDDETLCRQFQEAVETLEYTDSPIYVDIQCLKTIDSEFVMKEFCAECDGYPAACVTVKSPQDKTPDIEANRYGKTRVNGLNWEDGVMWPAQLRSTTSTLFGGHRRVFVKGDVKIDILVSVLGIPHSDITELSNMPNLRVMRRDVTLTEACPFHVHQREDLACAKKHTRSIIVHMTTDLPDPIQPEIIRPPPTETRPFSMVTTSPSDDETLCRQFQEAVETLESTDAPIYVDVLHLLTIDGNYVLKEFCAECEGYPAAWTTVKSPQDDVPDTRANRYREKRIHGLNWGDGVMWPEQLRWRTRTLFGGHRKVIVKDTDQAHILARVLGVSQTSVLPRMPRVIDMRGSVTLSEASCPFHEYRREIFACAKKHTRTMILHMGTVWKTTDLLPISGDDPVQPPPTETNPSAIVPISTNDTLCRQFQEAVRTLESTDAPIYVEVLYLLTIDGRCVIKEFCAECEGYPAAWITVKSPQDEEPDTEANRCSEMNIHGLKWNDGVMLPAQLRSTTATLFRGPRRVFVTGIAKIGILGSMLGIPKANITTTLINKSTLRKLRRSVTLTEPCPLHKHRDQIFACAKKHTRTMIVHKAVR